MPGAMHLAGALGLCVSTLHSKELKGSWGEKWFKKGAEGKGKKMMIIC